ncbi:hypothetical protein [Dysgonomonas macrotermitis]|uniref:Uncharacterized protein n=1 Tax=Dysgonomonas macrotermitis TaxID=1346286 RepID=A0A1M4UJ09_9BACT|nr:hypothetical protein [Dysgonomonas macrotermitis]SHE56689.1 hypothetical protein SAMN05444362_101618 [Dysgonomonas macrotermitis]
MSRNITDLGYHSAVIDLGNGHAAYINTIDFGELDSMLSDITDDSKTTPTKISGYESLRGYVPWGASNQRPYNTIDLIKADEVLAQNKHFNALTCYASGLTFKKENNEKIADKEITDFFKYNRPVKYLLDQCVDMKYFLFTVSVIILNKEGSKIVRIVHKEACHCRFESCNPKTGQIEHLYYANFRDNTPKKEDTEIIEVLDYYNPIGDLEVRLGKIPDDDGKMRKPTNTRKFAIINKFPTVEDKYYPIPPYYSIFHSGWYSYKRYIPIVKLAKLKNGTKVRYHVEIHTEYWKNLFKNEGITTDEAKKDRVKKQWKDIEEFLTGLEKSDKVWISDYYTDPSGKEIKYIRINLVDTTKEGGDFIDDSAEASNMMCYADAVHPAMIGATPGKSQGSYQGSVQRELFTIKQSLEKPYHDILLEPYLVIKEFNGWDDIIFDVPVITLTTLDKGKDTEENTMRTTNNN